MTWPRVRGRYLFREVNERGFDLPLASVTRDGGVEFRSDLDFAVWNPDDKTSHYKRVKPHDFVIGLRSFQSGIGYSNLEGLVSPAYTVLRPISSEVYSGFFKHLFKSDYYISRLDNVSQGIRQGRTISTEDFYDIRIAVPSVSEQRAIAHYLDTESARIDALISRKRRLIELLEERWRELRRARVLRGLDPVRGGGLDKPWQEMNLGVLIELQRGHDLPSDDRIEGTIPVVSSGGVSGFHNIAIADGPGVITGRYGTVGEVFFTDTRYWPLNTTLYVKDFRGNDHKWIYHLLSSIPLDIDSQKSAVGGINRNIVGSLRVPRPPVREQRAIARELDEAENSSMEARRMLGTQIQLLLERRQASITAVVTGEMQVPSPLT